MGVTFAKSVRMGAVRFNFSGSGIGVSVGLPGLRIGTGPRGAYIGGGVGGFRYRKSLAGGRSHPVQPDETPNSGPSLSPSPPSQAELGNVVDTAQHNTKNVLELQDSSEDELLRSINEQRGKSKLWPYTGIVVLVIFYALVATVQGLPSLFPLGFVVAGTSFVGWVAWRDRLRKLTVLFFEPDIQTQSVFAEIHAGATAAAASRKLASVLETAKYRDTKYTSGASQGVKFEKATISLGQAPGVRANVDVPLLKAGGTLLAFYPDRVLAFQGKAIGAIDYRNLKAQSGTTKFIEKDSLPTDAVVVGTTWQYINKSGGPDRRFKNNPEYPVCRYNEFILTTSDALDIQFMASRPDAFDALAAALEHAAR